MKQSFLTVMSTAGALLAASAVQAQHSYLPAHDSSGKIHTFVDPDNSGPLPFEPDQVVSNAFDPSRDVLVNDPSTGKSVFLPQPDYTRAGGPSAFTQASTAAAFDHTDGKQPFTVGFDTIPGGSDLFIKNPVLSDPHFSSTGNLLYWNGAGDTPAFGAVPTDVKVIIRRLDPSSDEQKNNGILAIVTDKTTLDGSDTEQSYLEDTSLGDGARNGHFHMQYDVVGDSGGGTFEAPDGIYLLGNIVSVAGLTDSDLVLIPLLKNAGGSEFLGDAFLASQSFLANNVVPEPATGLLFAIGGGLALVGFRRKATA